VLPQDHELRRREASLARLERRLAARQRDVAAREAELACDDDDRYLRALIVGARAAVRRSRLRRAIVRLGPIVVGLWLMAQPLLFPGEPRGLATAAVGGGAALAFIGLAGAHDGFRERWAGWTLGIAGTWVLAWGALGHGTTVCAWAMAGSGAAVWMTAIAAAVPRAA
jgi:hypothetical protein